MIALIEVLLVIWFLGGTAFYIWTYNDSKDGLSHACRKYNLPTFIGDVVSYITTLFVGFPYFIYKVIKGIFFER